MKVRASVKRECARSAASSAGTVASRSSARTPATSSGRAERGHTHMARIAGVDIPREKRLEISLTYIYGIGKTTAQKIADDLGLDRDTKVSQADRGRGQPRSATTSTRTSPLKVTCAATCRPTSSARSRSGACRASATARACPSAVSAPTPTQDPQGSQAHRCQQEEGCEEVIAMAKPKPGGRRPRKRDRKNISTGVVHIKSSFNNTIVTITDTSGNVISWASSGAVGFKGSRKSTPYAAQQAAERAAQRSHRRTVCVASRCTSRAPARAVTPLSARSRTPASRSPRSRTSPPCRTTAAPVPKRRRG